MSRALSPIYLSTIALDTTLRKLASSCLATARAKSVLPVPTITSTLLSHPLQSHPHYYLIHRVTVHTQSQYLTRWTIQEAAFGCFDANTFKQLRIHQWKLNNLKQREGGRKEGRREGGRGKRKEDMK